MSKKLGYVIAIDFEAFGTITLANGFAQLGAVLYDLDNDQVISMFNEYASQAGYTMDQRCYDEFWSKHVELHDAIQAKCAASTSSPHDVIDHFFEWVDTSAVSCPGMKDNCLLITDNAAFDAAILRCFARTRDPQYVFGPYRDIVDVSNIYYGLARVPVTKVTMDGSSKKMAMVGVGLPVGDLPTFPEFKEKAHSAEFDATVIAKYWSYFQHQLQHNMDLA